MPVVAQLEMNSGMPVDAEGFQVAAFCGDECRGIGVLVNGMMMINVHGNTGDVIGFRIIDDMESEMVSSSKITFSPDNVSTFASPLAINVESTTAVGEINADSFSVSSEDGELILKGDLSGVKSVEVYDIAGVMVAKATKAEGFRLEGLDKGVVTVVIRTASGTVNKKLVVR